MIPYEDLCRALDIYNRKLRGEDVSEEVYQQVPSDDFDIVESADAVAQTEEVGGAYADPGYSDVAAGEAAYTEGGPVATDPSSLPAADFGGAEPGAAPGGPAEAMAADQYSSGQQYQEGYQQPVDQQYQEGYQQPVDQQYQEGYQQPVDQQYQEGYQQPVDQQYQEGHEQPVPPPSDGHDPNSQQ